MDLVGAQEIGRLLGGLSRQRVSQLADAKDFPKPVAVLAQGKVWRGQDIRRWAKQHGREIHE